MSQTALTENPPIVLDATCSRRKIWPRYATIRIDIRPEMKPDIVMDAKRLRFPDAYFDEIDCDPPHLIRDKVNLESLKQSRRTGKYRGKPIMLEDYWYWRTREEWLEFVRETNKEFYRCLKPNGILRYKLGDRVGQNDSIHLYELLDGMTLFEVTKARRTWSGSHTKSKGVVHWLTMRKLDSNSIEPK